MRFILRSSFAVVWAVLALGCATTSPDASAAGHAECLVCKHNADLACVDVAVKADTPHYDFNGKTYYFCSDTCRDEFAKNPGKYAKPAP